MSGRKIITIVEECWERVINDDNDDDDVEEDEDDDDDDDDDDAERTVRVPFVDAILCWFFSCTPLERTCVSKI